ncbi:MAG TPA: histidine kinase [Terriglobales bacterium]
MLNALISPKFLDVFPESLLLLQKDGRIVFANKAAEQILKIPLPELIDHGLDTIVTDSSDKVAQYLQECSRTAQFHIGVLTFRSGDSQLQCRCDGAIVSIDGNRRLLLIKQTPQAQYSTPFIALNDQNTALNRARHHLENEVQIRTAELVLTQAALRELSGKLMQAQDEERRRLARDLHDSTGQLLAGIQINLSLLTKNSDLSPQVHHRLSETIKLTNQAIGEIRTLSYLLHPPFLDEAGLDLALKSYIDGFQDRSGIAVSLALPTELGRLGPEVETALFRVIQESLTNIHRHSGSDRADVRLSSNGDGLNLEIRDYGSGMPQAEISSKKGVGLRGMQERIRLLGGTFHVIDAQPGILVKAHLSRTTSLKPSNIEATSIVHK